MSKVDQPAEFQVTWTQEKLRKQPISCSKVVFKRKRKIISYHFVDFWSLMANYSLSKEFEEKYYFNWFSKCIVNK